MLNHIAVAGLLDRFSRHPAIVITVVYVGIGLSWILMSDWLLMSVSGSAYPALQSIKGALYVFFTGLLLFGLVSALTARLRGQARYDRLLFDANPLPMWLCNPNTLRILEANCAACALYGYTAKEFTALALPDLLASKPNVITLPEGEVRHLNRQGELLEVSLSSRPIENQLLVAVWNQTEQKRAERELQQLNLTLVRQNQDLHHFTYIVSHNLRAPAANLLGLLALYNEADPTDPLHPELIARLKETSATLDRTLLDLNEILHHRGLLELEREWIPLKSLLTELIQSQQPAGLDCELCLDLPDNPSLYGVRSYLYSILLNLISNAYKYREPSRPLMLHLSLSRHDNEQILSLGDNGRGIDLARYGERLFRFYQRFHAGLSGRGLGLYLVRTQVEMLGGRIEVASELGRGTTFTIHLPIPEDSPILHGVAEPVSQPSS